MAASYSGNNTRTAGLVNPTGSPRIDPPRHKGPSGSDHPHDARHARLLKGLATVSLRPLAGGGEHNVMSHMDRAGDHEPAIQELPSDRL